MSIASPNRNPIKLRRSGMARQAVAADVSRRIRSADEMAPTHVGGYGAENSCHSCHSWAHFQANGRFHTSNAPGSGPPGKDAFDRVPVSGFKVCARNASMPLLRSLAGWRGGDACYRHGAPGPDISHREKPREGTRPTGVDARACRPRALTRRTVAISIGV